jgi:hypothetical protein
MMSLNADRAALHGSPFLLVFSRRDRARFGVRDAREARGYADRPRQGARMISEAEAPRYERNLVRDLICSAELDAGRGAARTERHWPD